MGKKDREKQLEQLIKDLVHIPSVTGSPEECTPAQYLYDLCAGESYFKEYPEHLALTPEDEKGKCSFFALVKASRSTSKTLLFISHFDVVEVDVYGDLRHLAYDSEKLEDAFNPQQLPLQVREDLESRNWIFGRGVMDMKCGVALEADLLLEFARNPELYDANLAMLSVYDEEGSNTGMIRGVSFLQDHAKALNLDFIGAVNTEPSDAGRSGTEHPLIFTGSMGKCLAMFYAVGKETHCGSYFQGMSAALLQSCISREFEGNPRYSETVEGTVSLPPAALREGTVQEAPYSVTIPYQSISYYNIFTLRNNPGAVIGLLLEGASKAAREGALRMQEAWKDLLRRGYRGEGEPSWEAEVLTFEELRRRAAIHYPGDFQKEYQRWQETLSPDLDLRERCLKLVEKLLPWRGSREPLIVVGFLPPFIPHRGNRSNNPRERIFLEGAQKVLLHAQEQYGRTLEIDPFFGGLCDLSYLGWEQDPQDFRILRNNLPGWGTFYSLPADAMKELDMPVLNLGPLGRDPHKHTERLERDYALRELPELLRFFIRSVSEN